MIEVEVKLPLYRRSLTEQALVRAGFQPGALIKESDWYYNGLDRDFKKTDEALRIRQSENMTSLMVTAELTYKGPKIDQVSMARKELETKIGDFKTTRNILSALGYQELAPVIKLRQYYHKDDITACVDQVEGLGSFLELEIIVADEEQRPQALERIESLLESLDSSMRETTTKSYLCMLLQRQGVDII